ncbi:hypothetical protein ScPMuIL_010669 [Solemya velum]
MEENNNKEPSGPSRTEVEKLREIFFRRHSEKVNSSQYDERDLDKIRSDESFVGQYIRPQESMEEVSDRMSESLKFRMEYGMNDMTKDSFDQWAWEKGAVFFHNQDKDGHQILFIKTREYRKDMNILPMVKRFFAFALETVYRRNVDEQVVILFDMSEAGLANLDMDLIRFVMTSFKTYYPKILAYMLIFEMPWIFNAAWKIIKTWMSADAVKKIKFVSKTNIQEYIDRGQLLEHMGGTDKYVYKYIPEESNEDSDKDQSPSNLSSKKVTFADNSIYRSFSEDSNNMNKEPNAMKVKTSERDSSENSFVGRLLTISPAEELEISAGEGAKDRCGIISLKNTLPYSIAYKVKTTSPEKYRVRPCSGLVRAGSKVDVCVILQQAYHQTSAKDKFLVMAVEVTDERVDNISDLWKTVPKESTMEHRIRCVQSTSDGSERKDKNHILLPDHVNLLLKQIDNLVVASEEQRRKLNALLLFQSLFLVLLMGLCILLLYK